jgi:hypothetical protein
MKITIEFNKQYCKKVRNCLIIEVKSTSGVSISRKVEAGL